MNKKNNQKGVIAILTIIIISASVLIMAFNSSILGLGELDMGFTSQKGSKTLFIADGCIEEALRQISFNQDYTAENYLLSIDQWTCIINVSNDNPKIINVLANEDEEYYKEIEVSVSLIGGIININSWEEKEN